MVDNGYSYQITLRLGCVSVTQAIATRFMDKAVDAYQKGNVPEAIFAALTALDESEWPLRGHILHALATIACEVGDRSTAVRYWNQFFHDVDGNDFPALKLATSHFDFGYTCRLLGMFDDAINEYNAALPTLRAEGEHVSRCLQNLAWAHCMWARYDDSGNSAALAAKALEESHVISIDGDDLHHQLVGEAFLYAVSKCGEQALTIINNLLNSSADNTVKAQACYVALVVAVDSQDKDLACAWFSRMKGYAGDDKDLAYDVERAERLLDTV